MGISWDLYGEFYRDIMGYNTILWDLTGFLGDDYMGISPCRIWRYGMYHER